MLYSLLQHEIDFQILSLLSFSTCQVDPYFLISILPSLPFRPSFYPLVPSLIEGRLLYFLICNHFLSPLGTTFRLSEDAFVNWKGYGLRPPGHAVGSVWYVCSTRLVQYGHRSIRKLTLFQYRLDIGSAGTPM